ncbi:hypothetical protein SEA_JACOREN57_62 [Mycobacterium phage JacoRen57]|nr:hypothetical protein SEA_JACOREN57_62 [Mycobacterium phage JacoRen57]
MAQDPTQPSDKKKRPPFSWAQPCCTECWNGLKLKTGRPGPPSDGTVFCCYCRAQIPEGGGVYTIRLNPGTVPYPTVRKDPS